MQVNFCAFFLFIWVVNVQSKCPMQYQPPTECFPTEELQEYGSIATSIEKLYNRYVNLLTDADLIISSDEPGINLFFGGELKEKVRKLKYYGNSVVTFLEIALHHLDREHGLSAKDLLYCLEQHNVTADFFNVCEKYEPVDCSKKMTKYQPIDGICVNQNEPYRGASNTPYRRLLSNSYRDFIHEVRTGADNGDLPSARLVSSSLRTLYIPTIFESDDNVQNDFTVFYLSQVVYDLAKTLKAQTWSGNYGFECCETDGKAKISDRFHNRHCFPIEIPLKDPVFHGARCMNYIRALATHDNCELKEASILNTKTHYLDMDFLYVPETIKAAVRNGGKFPVDTEVDMHRIIILGDERSAMFPQFYSLVIVWVKFHNLVVDELLRIHPAEISADIIFYEARRFVIAVYQHILYSELIPVLLGGPSITKYRLTSKRPCFDPTVDPTTTAEFTSSAARYLHTFIHDRYIVNFKNGTVSEILLRHLNDESLGYEELAGVLSGLLDRPWNTQDIANEPSNYLFTSNDNPGLDLRAMDLQTERDFGLGTYCDALHYFNLINDTCVERFSDFKPFISDENIDFLKYAYSAPCDVDFGVGASMHNSEDGGLLSDIFEKVLALQFKNSKCGDPYFYTNALSRDQVNFVSGFSFRDILCYAVPDVSPLQPSLFLTPGEGNEKEQCVGYLNLEEWQISWGDSGNTEPIDEVESSPETEDDPLEVNDESSNSPEVEIIYAQEAE